MLLKKDVTSMPRIVKPLTDTEIRQAKPRDKEYNLSDGKQLAIRIKTNGTKLWTLNYYRPGTRARTNVSLGVYPDVSLAAARKHAEELRQVLTTGIDPKEHREQQDSQRQQQHTNTFENVCRKWLELKKGKVSTVYYDKIVGRLEKYIFPKMGRTPIHKVSASTTIDIISPLAKAEKLETVKKICRWVNEAMVYAVNTGVIHSNPLSGIGKAFNAPTVTNMPTIGPEQLPDLMYRIQHSSTKLVTRCLIEWQLHTMVRPGEAAAARWDEIDEDLKIWAIPAARMKMRDDHIVPLTQQTMRLLQTLKPISGHREFIFPGDHDPLKSAHPQTVNRALKRMGYASGALVSHGFRSLASTTLNEKEFPPDIIEKALAHKDGNAIRGTYNRAQYLERRRDMMEWWSNFIDSCAAGRPMGDSHTSP